MTVVSAIVDGNVCIFSSDSGSFSDESVSIRNNSKVFSKMIKGAGECLVGFAGTFAICQWIKFLEFPELTDNELDQVMTEFFEWDRLQDYDFVNEFDDFIYVSFDEVLNNPNDAELGALIRKRYIEAQDKLKESPSL